MSWILVAVLAIFVLFGFLGFKKGLIKIAISLCSLIVPLAVCIIVTPTVAKLVRENTSIEETMQKAIYTMFVNNSKLENDSKDDAYSDVIIPEGEVDVEAVENSKNQEWIKYATEIGEKAGIPATIISGMEEMDISGKLSKFVDGGVASAKQIVCAMIAVRLSSVIVNAIIYIVLFVILFIITRIVLSATNIISHLPVIHQANALAGTAVGLVEAIIVVWLLFAVITALSSNAWAATALTDIGNNSFLSFLYDNNLIFNSMIKNI